MTRRSLYVVDGHSHLFRAYHAVGYLSTSRGVPSHAVLILSTMLWKLFREEQPDYLAIALDPPGPTFRDKLFTEYKATRTAMPDDLARQLPYVRRLFEALRTPTIEVQGYEADDVIATIVEHALKLDDLDVVIVTGDKDLLQLVGPRVRVLSVLGRTGERVVYDEAKVRERWGVAPGQIADVLALMGDSIDNIPGVKGVGEKTAVKLLDQFGSVDRIYENLTLVQGKLRETLAVSRKQALLSRELATVSRSVPFAFDLESYRRAADFLNINSVDLVCLQFEYGIFGGRAGSHILALLRDLRVPIVTTLHTILREPDAHQRRVLTEVAGLSDRLVVMSKRGAEFL